MLDLSWSHILIFLVVALVVIGPKDLPKFLNTLGKGLGRMRRLAEQFRASFDDMARQSELDELRKEIAALRDERVPEPVAEVTPDSSSEGKLSPEREAAPSGAQTDATPSDVGDTTDPEKQ